VLIENTLFGKWDKVQIAIGRLRKFEPPEGYYLAFSGGKDSQCVYHLAKEAGVKFDAHYRVTGVDPPELVYFIRENYPDVHRDLYEKSMWKLIVNHGIPPDRWKRYCCAELKERGGEGRFSVTGVRWAESARRAKTRSLIEIRTVKSEKRKMFFADNDEMRKIIETTYGDGCPVKGERILNPIIDWGTEDVWEYLNSRKIEHCKLYDEGFTRLGCIGCPLAGTKRMLQEFERWPKFKAAYIRAFDRAIAWRKQRGLKCTLKTGREMFDWWVYYEQDSKNKDDTIDGQTDMFGGDTVDD
jgi:phosphoadenosine phosphosulfate reductase